jgi:hypothetical protein
LERFGAIGPMTGNIFEESGIGEGNWMIAFVVGSSC